jgi:hypothetical protein
MRVITISNLSPVGLELFQDSETFLHDLTQEEVVKLTGGFVVSQVSLSAGFKVLGSNPGIYQVYTKNTNINQWTFFSIKTYSRFP